MRHPQHLPFNVKPAVPTHTLDPEALARLHELDPDGIHGVVQRVLAAFRASLVRMLALLQSHRERSDAAEVANVAHTLKSAAASVGALELSGVCAQVELRLRGGQTGTLCDDVDLLLLHGGAALQAVGAMLPDTAQN